ncbi:hypothetical protein EU99_1821 [Prochlorococcus marinus str. MIT 9321]|uniref:ADP-heptose:LPS heptosyltransferase n=1 Tax=Prochlorococcus marinus str. MIT 9401 TaxID=167551 RepID=A0A0A2B9I5_PROMR|nr:glycosyltransferase family 9 protein [Prochlorococcus marinus]KGG02859.1 hypothetical protein EU99_1821 [Prochlorococcus marinus str. MIT 9321]KGG05482.1 hypothetical protein EV00_1116 [Prochlorococcus marinus str. MIT 9322]KGG10516.1 hypothetical protein EV01_0144 [Prochlorococcus marinus str. MIT 9401]
MKNKVIFEAGLGNKIIFIHTLIENLNINEKDKFLKVFLLNNQIDKLPYKFFSFLFLRLILLSIISIFSKNRYIIFGLNLSDFKKFILSKISYKLKFYSYPSVVFNGEKFLYISEQDFYRPIINKESFIKKLITNEILEKYKLEDNFNDFKLYFKREIIALHLGSDFRNTYKRPFINNLAEALNKIPCKNKFIFLLLGQSQDKDTSDKFLEYVKFKEIDIKVINLISKTNLSKLIDILKSSKFLIAGDSGIRQIADFLEINNIALFGPTSEVKNLIKPINHKRAVVRGLKCKGYFYNKCDCRQLNGYPECMLSISSENLYEKIKNFI